MRKDFYAVQDIIRYTFKNKELLVRAFTHNSGIKKGSKQSYQNLEFLGDSIVDFVIAEELLHRHPNFNEGQLTRMRSAIVSEKPLAQTIERLKLNKYLIMGASEVKMGIENNYSVMSDLFESIAASIYFDGGLEKARKFILWALMPIILKNEADKNDFYDYKTILNEFATKNNLSINYVNVEQSNTCGKQTFVFDVTIDGDNFGRGEGYSKKEAQQKAARVAWEKINKK